MILCDAGPLIALVDQDDEDHAVCRALLPSLTRPLISTWPCLTEAMYILGHRSGFHGQSLLWNLVRTQKVTLHAPAPDRLARMRELMTQYQDLPMDLADASLVAAAEALSLPRIFTLDGDFRVYRLSDGRPFEIVP